MQYACPPISRRQLRSLAFSIRKLYGLEDTLYFPVEQFLEVLHVILADDDFYYEIVSDKEWNAPLSTHAYYDMNDNAIFIRQSVYDSACQGNGRDRMTIIHECAHAILLKGIHFTLTRSFDENIPPYKNPEWQAKCLAGELMVPAHLIQGMSASEIAVKCGVSYDAAKYQLNKCS